ncbi:histidine utilization repressor [Simiduia aestuariiviva]|uniref:Histidine utilization repressor n=1 Tax=Simiduia aestuariiviva TaxID=1510459 RepID=A0A839ULU1_9GAMM|nr:histidine utilization repressor [Simiduia aestuariiviva]MBB3168653.1 GntR family histidine utilization transcriptional repressor [Simiduia aestuariiviva]
MEPRYLTIKQALLARIEGGILAAGARVASENELASEFGVSRMTARRALDALADEGVLIRTQGLGTFVADERPSSNLIEIRNIADEIHGRGHAYHCQVLTLEAQAADAKQALRLGLASGGEIFFSRLLHCENALPVQLEERWVNPKFAPDYLAQRFGAQDLTPSGYLNKVVPLTEADHLIEAVGASETLQSLLQLAQGEPCLKVSRRTFGPAGIVSYAQLFHPGSRYRLGGHINY